jgi:hypothetical protein
MPRTATVMNLCIFGAVAGGPTAGALLLAAHRWRPLFWAVAGLAAAAFLLAVLTYDDQPAQDREAPWDVVAVALALGGCFAAFVGVGLLGANALRGPGTPVLLIGGTALVVGLVVHQYRAGNPLMPVKAAATTVPAAGILVALVASAAGFGVMELLLDGLKHVASPGRTALLFVPELVAAVLVAGLFGALFRTRFTPLLAMAGLPAIAAAAVLLVTVLPSGGPLVGVATGLVGLGVAASVSPALFMAGFSLRSSQLQRVFAMIELMRGVTAFLVAPILVFLATSTGSASPAGVRTGLWICVAVAGAGLAGGVGLYVAGRGGLQRPDLERWQEKDEPAWDSPPLLDRLRRRRRRGLSGLDAGDEMVRRRAA